MAISSYPPVWPTRPSNEPGRYDLASALRDSPAEWTRQYEKLGLAS